MIPNNGSRRKIQAEKSLNRQKSQSFFQTSVLRLEVDFVYPLSQEEEEQHQQQQISPLMMTQF